jgi:cytochrome oxidase assembly protein ShyY1
VLRFILTRRWIGLLLAVIVVGVGCVELGLWQFHRYGDRSSSNDVTEANLAADPIPVGDVMSVESSPGTDDEWRVVEATGSYDASQQLLVLYRTREGAPGVDVVVPLLTDDGTALLVDRGWVQTGGGSDNLNPDVPEAPTGTVTVQGWVRRNASGGDTQTVPRDGSVRAISSDKIGPTLPYPVYDGFIDLTDEQPTPAEAPIMAEAPDLGSGPHFFYGLQWFFFALLAFGFWCYFAWAEWDRQRRESARDNSTGVDAAETAG